MFVLSVYQKLRLQLAVRDKLIQRQQNVLTEHGLDGKVIPLSHMYSPIIGTLLSYVPPLSCVPPFMRTPIISNLSTITLVQSYQPLSDISFSYHINPPSLPLSLFFPLPSPHLLSSHL